MTATQELLELFDAERAVRPPSGLAERGLVRLVEGLAAPAAVPAAASATKLGLVGVSKWVLGGMAVGITGAGIASAVLGSGGTSPHESAAMHAAAPRARPTSTPTATPARVTPRDEPTARASAESRPEAAQPRASRLPAGMGASSSPRETFDAELRLINAAKVQLDAGRPHLAKVWLDEHAARYPTGVFATEREAVRVLAACAEQRDPLLAERFVNAHPTSALRDRLTRACDGTNSK